MAATRSWSADSVFVLVHYVVFGLFVFLNSSKTSPLH